MKHTTLTIVLAIAAGITTTTASAGNALEDMQKQEAHAADLTAASQANPGDQKLAARAAKATSMAQTVNEGWEERLGVNWRDHWGPSNTYANKDDVLVDLFVGGRTFSVPNLWHRGLSVSKRLAILDHIAAKDTLVKADLDMVKGCQLHHPGIEAKLPALAAALPSKGIRGEEYYEFRNIHVLRRSIASGEKWQSTMQVADWLDLATGPAHFSVETFTIGRHYLILTAAKLLMDKRQAEGLSTEGPEFDAAFAPLVAAFKAPKFQGLQAILTDLGINPGIPADIDWSKQEAIAALVETAAERKAKFLTPWGVDENYEKGLGSVMLIKGETAYQAWRATALTQ